MQLPQIHVHPRNDLMGIYGCRLETGDVLHADDVYDSSSGDWQKTPVPGLPIGEGNDAMWVRPIVPFNNESYELNISNRQPASIDTLHAGDPD